MVQRRVIGSYDTEAEAIAVIEDLKRQGYSSDDISVMSKHTENAEIIADETGTHAADGAATGAATGGLLGGLGGVLAGVGALAIPGIGPIIAAWPDCCRHHRSSSRGRSRRTCRRTDRHGHT